MSLLFADGFDHYTGAGQKWSSTSGTVSITGTYARTGIGGVRFADQDAYVEKSGLDETTVYTGFSIKPGVGSPTTGSGIVTILSGTEALVKVTLDSSYNVVVLDGDDTLLGSGTSIGSGSWGFLEVGALIDSSGWVDVRWNGERVFAVTGSTDPISSGALTAVRYAGINSGIESWVDNLYIAESFYGPSAVDTFLPSNSGTLTEWTPSTGTDNYALVDDTYPDTDTYVSATGITTVDDVYTYPVSYAAYQGIGAVQQNYDASGAGTLYPIESTGTVGGAIDVGSDYLILPAPSSTIWTPSTLPIYFGMRGRRDYETPYELPGLQLWWDGSNTGTLYQTTDTSTPVSGSGNPVGRIEDQSGNGYHLTQGTAGARPTWIADIGNGYPGLYCDGGDYLWNAAAPNYTNPSGTVIMILHSGDSVSDRCPFTYCRNSDTYYLQFYKSSTNVLGYAIRYGGSPVSTSFTGQALGSGTFAICIVSSDDVNYYGRINGSDQLVGGSNNGNWCNGTTLNRLGIGALARPSVANYWLGHIMEVITYETYISGNDLTFVEEYLSAKWGIALA